MRDARLGTTTRERSISSRFGIALVLVVLVFVQAAAPAAAQGERRESFHLVVPTSTSAPATAPVVGSGDSADTLLLGATLPDTVAGFDAEAATCYGYDFLESPATGDGCPVGIGMERLDVRDRAFARFTATVVDSGPGQAEIMTGFMEHGGQRVHPDHRSGPASTVSGIVPSWGLDLGVFLDANGATWAEIEVYIGPPPDQSE